jgi:hypothetical protein
VTSQESKIRGREPMRVNPTDGEQRGIRDVRVSGELSAALR